MFYPAGDLPTEELNRWIGHWNLAEQWEVFAAERGEVALVVKKSPGSPVEVVHCPVGQAVPLPPSSWHLTYVVKGPAVVTNIYLTVQQQGPGHGKYFARPTVRAGLRREDGDLVQLAQTPLTAVPPRLAPSSPAVLGDARGLASLLVSRRPVDLLVDPTGWLPESLS